MSESILWRGSSETLTEVEYRPQDCTLRVLLKDGVEVTHQNVPFSTWIGFCQADFKDEFYGNQIQRFYKQVMNEAKYTRGQEAIRLLAQFREHQKTLHGTSWERTKTIGGTSVSFDDEWIPAVNAVLDKKS